MNSLKKKGLMSKFGKFAISSEKIAKINGGVMALCGSGDAEYIIASNTIEGLRLSAGDGCRLV